MPERLHAIWGNLKTITVDRCIFLENSYITPNHSQFAGVPNLLTTMRKLLLANLAVSLCANLWHPGHAQVLPFDYYTVKDGLPSNWITAVYQDSQGYLWIGGDGGLAVYDGISFKNYTVTDGLPAGHVWYIAESSKSPGTMYIGAHGGGLVKFKNGSFTSLPLSEKFHQNVVNCIIEDYDGVIWCATDGGVFRVEDDSVVYIPSGSALKHAPFVYQTSDSLVWFFHDGNVNRVSPRTLQLERFDLEKKQARYGCILEDDDGKIWLGTDGILHLIVNDRVVASRTISPSPLRKVVDDRSGNLWFATTGGILKLPKHDFPNAEPTHYTSHNGLSSDDVWACSFDRESNLWFGTRGGGLMKLTDRNVYSFPIAQLDGVRTNNGVVVDERNHPFVASGNGVWELWKSRDGLWRSFLHDLKSLQAPAQPAAVNVSPDGALWVGFEGGVLHGYRCNVQPQKPSRLHLFKTLKPEIDLHTGDRFGRFMIDRNNQLWYGRTALNGVTQFDLNTMQRKHTYTRDDGLLAGLISAMLLDRDGHLWLGEFRGGIAVLRPEGDRYVLHRTFTKADGLAGDQIRAIIQRRNGEIWIGHRFDGISIFKDNKFETVSTKDGLLNNAVWTLAEDDSGRVWIGTSVGVQYTATESDHKFISPKKLLGKAIQTIGHIRKENAAFVLSESELAIYDMSEAKASPEAIPISIKGLRINGSEADWENSLKFSYGENLYEIDFIGISLRDERALRYEYRLVNDKGIEWKGSTQQRTVQYTSLQPGRYKFEAIAVTSDGVRSPQPARLGFTILPPVWQRWWFIALSSFVVGAFLYGLHRIRLQRALAVEKIRARIASDLHDDIGAGLTHIGLLSEMALRHADSVDAEQMKAKDKTALLREMSQSMARAGEVARELSAAMSDVVWSINPKHDSVAALHRRLKAFANTICQAKGIKLNMEVSDRIFNRKLHPEVRRNLLLIAKEALHNTAKYSASPSVDVRIEMDGNDLTVIVEDHGSGFEMNGVGEGNGLLNMRNRAEKLGGKCEIVSEIGKGTQVKVVVLYKI